jgi:hypothetical protein
VKLKDLIYPHLPMLTTVPMCPMCGQHCSPEVMQRWGILRKEIDERGAAVVRRMGRASERIVSRRV